MRSDTEIVDGTTLKQLRESIAEYPDDCNVMIRTDGKRSWLTIAHPLSDYHSRVYRNDEGMWVVEADHGVLEDLP